MVSRISIHQQLPGNELILRSPEAPKGGVESLALREPGERYPSPFKGQPPPKMIKSKVLAGDGIGGLVSERVFCDILLDNRIS